MANFKDFSKINLTKIQGLEKITLVKISDFGYPIVCNLKLDSNQTRLEDYAQYKNTLVVIGKLPRKRNLSGFRVRPNEEFYIYEGTITEDEFNSFKKIISKTDTVTTESWGLCFSDGALDKFVSGCDKEPLLSYKEI